MAGLKEGDIHLMFSDTLKASDFPHYLKRLFSNYPAEKNLIIVLESALADHLKKPKQFLKANEDKLELIFLPPI